MNINQKEKINCVKMFLGVQYVSQISIVDRTNFVLGILEGDDSQLVYQTILTKPIKKNQATAAGDYGNGFSKRSLHF